MNRNRLKSALSSEDKKLRPGLVTSNDHAAAAWWLSNTDRSLYNNAYNIEKYVVSHTIHAFIFYKTRWHLCQIRNNYHISRKKKKVSFYAIFYNLLARQTKQKPYGANTIATDKTKHFDRKLLFYEQLSLIPVLTKKALWEWDKLLVYNFENQTVALISRF